jgi:extradiol dioxygenase family protein
MCTNTSFPPPPLEAGYVNHISYSVNDYKKVRDFYVDLLVMKSPKTTESSAA